MYRKRRSVVPLELDRARPAQAIRAPGGRHAAVSVVPRRCSRRLPRSRPRLEEEVAMRIREMGRHAGRRSRLLHPSRRPGRRIVLPAHPLSPGGDVVVEVLSRELLQGRENFRVSIGEGHHPGLRLGVDLGADGEPQAGHPVRGGRHRAEGDNSLADHRRRHERGAAVVHGDRHQRHAADRARRCCCSEEPSRSAARGSAGPGSSAGTASTAFRLLSVHAARLITMICSVASARDSARTTVGRSSLLELLEDDRPHARRSARPASA